MPKLKAHGANVVSTVGKAVAGLQARPWSCARGARKHVEYGILEPHYDVVGALLMTLEQGPGDAFTPEVKGLDPRVRGSGHDEGDH